MFITVDRYISAFMKASILIVLLSLLMASISIGSSIKMVVDSPKIVSATGLQGISKLNVNASHLGDKGEGNFSHLYGNAQIYEGTVAERQTFGDMGGEEMVERQSETWKEKADFWRYGRRGDGRKTNI